MNDANEDMFGGETDKNAMTIIEEMAVHVALEDAACVADKKALTDRQNKLKEAKITLFDTMKEAGFQSVKLENGLSPSCNLVTKYFKASGVEDEVLFDWLWGGQLHRITVMEILEAGGIPDAESSRMAKSGMWNVRWLCSVWPGLSDEFHAASDHDFSDIIKPTVHWGTLNSTMKDFVGGGGELPELVINAVPEKGIRMNGKSKFLAAIAEAAETPEARAERWNV